MRILLVSHSFPPENYAGTEIYTYNLSRNLINAGHEVFVVYRSNSEFSPNYSIQMKEFNSIPIFTLNKLSYKENFEASYYDKNIDSIFSDLLNILNPDIVHINHLINLSFGIVNVIKESKISTVMTLHDYWLICPQIHLHKIYDICNSKNNLACSECIQKYGYSDNIDNIIKRDTLTKEIIEKIDMIISPSEFLKNKLRELFKIDRKDIIHLSNGVQLTDHYKDSNLEAYKHSKIVLGFFGTIAEGKGLHILLKAFEKVDKKLYDLKIYGNCESNYVSDLDNKFKWWRDYYKGEYKNDEAIDLMRKNIDFLIFPSIIYENCPTVINEAFSAGVPVLCVNIGGAPELIKEDYNGYFFENLNPVDLLKKINRITLEINTKLKENLKNYQPNSFKSHTKSVVDLYKSLLKNKSIKNNPINIVDLFKIERYLSSKQYLSKINIDTDDGFNQTIQQIMQISDNGRVLIDFALINIKKIKLIRFYPIENQFCKLKFDKLFIENEAEKSIIDFSTKQENLETNGELTDDGWIVFKTLSPEVILPISGIIKKLTISFDIEIVDLLIGLKDILTDKDKIIKMIYNSKIWKLSRIISWLPRKISNIFNKL